MRDPSRGAPLNEFAMGERSQISIDDLDVTEQAGISRVVERIISHSGRIDVLVNNAGIAIPGPIEEIAEEDARAVFETNFWGPFRLIRAVLPYMRSVGSGLIVNVSSVGARMPGRPMNAIYGLTKSAISRLSEALSAEVASTGVRVVAVEPGMYATRVYRTRPPVQPSSPYAAMLSAYDEALATGIANGADPAEVGEAIAALLDDPDPPVRLLVGDDAKRRAGAPDGR